MSYNFDEIIYRKGSHSVKWEFLFKDQKPVHRELSDDPLDPNQILPLWVADMDFPTPQPVIDVLVARAKHGIFGYSVPTDSFFEAIIGWMKCRHSWQIERDWILTTPGVVPTINLLIQTYTQPNDKILIQRPVYHPFSYAIENNKRQIINSPLILKDGRYEIDFADFEAKLADGIKMFILCSPHNPVSRVWDKAELQKIAELCAKYNTLVISDEIHHDLIFSWADFTTYGVANPTLMDNTIVCTAPSKTFNLPGLKTSNTFIPNPELRAQFEQTLMEHGLHGVNSFGIVALETAYRHGEDWLTQAMAYVEENYLFMERFMQENLPQLTLIKPEGTYLIWCDCRQLNMDSTTLHQFLLDEAKLFLSNGSIFGKEGEGFVRFNIACPRPILAEALHRLHKAISTL